MFGFSNADWLFILFIMAVIAACVVASAAIQRKKSGDGT